MISSYETAPWEEAFGLVNLGHAGKGLAAQYPVLECDNTLHVCRFHRVMVKAQNRLPMTLVHYPSEIAPGAEYAYLKRFIVPHLSRASPGGRTIFQEVHGKSR
jgi:hypothetical protein